MFIQGKEHRGEKTDIWALGITMYKILTGVFPHRNYQNVFDFRDQVIKNQIDYSPIKNQLIVQLFKKIFIKDPEERATLSDLAIDPWLSNYGVDPINLEAVEH